MDAKQRSTRIAVAWTSGAAATVGVGIAAYKLAPKMQATPWVAAVVGVLLVSPFIAWPIVYVIGGDAMKEDTAIRRQEMLDAQRAPLVLVNGRMVPR